MIKTIQKLGDIRKLILRKINSPKGATKKIRLLKNNPDTAKRLPATYRVCSTGCDTFTDPESNLTCGKCGSPMKERRKVYPDGDSS